LPVRREPGASFIGRHQQPWTVVVNIPRHFDRERIDAALFPEERHAP
jgi:hypothetical protein